MWSISVCLGFPVSTHLDDRRAVSREKWNTVLHILSISIIYLQTSILMHFASEALPLSATSHLLVAFFFFFVLALPCLPHPPSPRLHGNAGTKACLKLVGAGSVSYVFHSPPPSLSLLWETGGMKVCQCCQPPAASISTSVSSPPIGKQTEPQFLDSHRFQWVAVSLRDVTLGETSLLWN